MSESSRLGSAFRTLGSLLNVRAVRNEDTMRAPRRTTASGSAQRLRAIEAEVLAVEASLRHR